MGMFMHVYVKTSLFQFTTAPPRPFIPPSWSYRCNGRVQLTDVHAAGRVLTVVRVVGDPPIFTRLHGRLGGVRVQVDELLPWQGAGPTDSMSVSGARHGRALKET